MTKKKIKKRVLQLILYFKGAVSPRFSCMLAKTAQMFDKEPLL